MKVPELHQRVISIARANPPSDRVPVAFEKRITALLAGRPRLDLWTLWSGALWRGAAGCLIVMLLMATISAFIPQNPSSPADLSQDFVNTMLASADHNTDAVW